MHCHANRECIAANLAAMQDMLIEADKLVGEARLAIADNQNRAIGTILPLERTLPAINALFSAIILLHRKEASAPSPKVQS